MSVFRWIEPPVRGRQRKRERAEQPAAGGDTSALFELAERYRNSGRLSEAAAYYEKAVCFDSGLSDAWIGLVDSLVRLGKVREADKAVERALALYRLTRPFYALKALVLLHTGHENEALRYSDISIEQDEAGWYPWFVRGEVLLSCTPGLVRTENARHCFERSITLAERQWAACLWVGLVLLVAKHTAVGAAYLAESAHLNPLNAFTWLKLGEAFRTMRFFDQAKFYYEQALDLDPECEPARRGLAEASSSRSRISYLIDARAARSRWTRRFGLQRNRKATTE
jgi:tetratricopeptide (TPR) repeat protein